MKRDLRRFAPLGLYLALAAALVSFGLYIVQREFNLYLQISLTLIVIGLALFAIFDPERVRQAFTGRQARYGSNALVLGLAFLGILIVINYFVFENTQRWDLTEDKQNTLTDETLATLESLPETVHATAFFSPMRNAEFARNLLDNYQHFSGGNFEYEFIDPESNPGAVIEANVTMDGSIVFRMGDKQELTTAITEKEFTGALVRLMSDAEHKVYFLSGHGEYSPDETSDEGYSFVSTSLQGKGYIVEALNLLTQNQVPDDASLVVVAGPLHPITEAEVDLLAEYLQTGGAMLVLSEPTFMTEAEADQPDHLRQHLIDHWGLTLGDDVIVDQTSPQPFIAYAGQYSQHVIVAETQTIATAFPTARSIQIDPEAEDVFPVELIFTSAQSWAETDLDAIVDGGEIGPDEGVDQFGPVLLAAVSEQADGDGKVVLFGDADFASNANFGFLGNGDIFINAVDWAVGQETLINLTPRDPIQRVMLPPQPYTLNIVLLVVIFVLPGTVLATGIVTWVRGRRRG